MLFRRRASPSWFAKTRAMLWPTRGYHRSWRYIVKRVLRVNATPYAIAMGIACGVFVSFTPLLGLHFVIAFALVYLLRANYLAAVFGTFVGNPVTFPLIWAFTFRVGQVVLGRPVHHEAEPTLNAPSTYTLEGIAGFVERAWPVIKPMLVGSVPLGLTAAVAAYFLTFGTVVGYQRARKARLIAAHKKRMALANSVDAPAQ
ncbi:MAG: DUF2062 domain-containing protein [Devosiaceae bacterium]